ncbi:MAG: hypothetical protein ACLFPS_04795 [Clostridia bacterium]
MKKLALIVLIILIVLAIKENVDEVNPNEQAEVSSMTGKIIHVEDESFYVEVLTGLHFDKATVKLSSDFKLDEQELSEYKPQDILVFEISYIDSSTSQAIVITNNIVKINDKKT